MQDILTKYIVIHTNTDSLVLIRGDQFDDEWVHEWNIAEPQPNLADIVQVALRDDAGRVA